MLEVWSGLLEKIKLIWIGQLQDHKKLKERKKSRKKEEKIHIHTRAIHTHFIITVHSAAKKKMRKKMRKSLKTNYEFSRTFISFFSKFSTPNSTSTLISFSVVDVNRKTCFSKLETFLLFLFFSLFSTESTTKVNYE